MHSLPRRSFHSSAALKSHQHVKPPHLSANHHRGQKAARPPRCAPLISSSLQHSAASDELPCWLKRTVSHTCSAVVLTAYFTHGSIRIGQCGHVEGKNLAGWLTVRRLRWNYRLAKAAAWWWTCLRRLNWSDLISLKCRFLYPRVLILVPSAKSNNPPLHEYVKHNFYCPSLGLNIIIQQTDSL